MLDDIRKPKAERREWIVEILKDMDGKHTGFLHMGDLVRCKDCRDWDEEDHRCNIRDSYGWDYKPDDYCSYGERKESE